MAFFYQSGWLMIATVVGGAFMYGVHVLTKSKSIGAGDYGEFGVYLSLVMCVPQAPLQMVMAQQTARGLATGRDRQVSAVFRGLTLGIFGLWLVVAAVILVCRDSLLSGWKITGMTGLLITLPALLLQMWLPLFQGALQGRESFLWFGWSQLSNGVVRLGVAAAVLAFHWGAPGMMAGVAAGLFVAAAIACWQARPLWSLPPAAVAWRELARQAAPLVIGFWVIQFLFTSDTIFVKKYFTKSETDAYLSAGTLCRALMWVVGPLVTVMFPRIIRSSARAEKTDLVGVVLIGTASLSILGALGLALVGPFVVRLIYTPEYVRIAAPLLAWYAAAMVPLALANVLLNTLLARGSFKVVPVLGVMAVVYIVGLSRYHDSLLMILQVMGVCNVLVFAAGAWFTWGPGKAVVPAPAAGAAA